MQRFKIMQEVDTDKGPLGTKTLGFFGSSLNFMQAMKKDHARLFEFIKSLVLNLPNDQPRELTRVGSDPKFDN